MFSRGIRGAITIEEDNQEMLEQATIELYSKMIELNGIKTEEISHIIFTLTKDIKSAFPAKFVRRNFDVQYVPFICVNEMDIEPSLKHCLRVLMVVNTDKKQNEIKHVYLGGAKILRSDLVSE
mgnify:FL=1